MKFLNGDLRIKISPEILSQIVRNNSNIVSNGEVIYTKVKKADYEVDIVIREADNCIMVIKITNQNVSPDEIIELYNRVTKDFGSNTDLLVIFTDKYDRTIIHPRIFTLALNCYLYSPALSAVTESL